MSLSQLRFVLALVILATLPTWASAQDDDGNRTSVLRRGTRSIVLPFPTTDGNASFGFWQMRSDRTNLGLMATVGVNHVTGEDDVGSDTERTEIDLRLGPSIKRYFTVHPSVAAFGVLGAQALFLRSDAGVETTRTSWGGVLNLGMGAEWFPFDRISLGGTTGLNAGFTTRDNDDAVTESSSSQLFLRTFTSVVQVQVYF